MSEEVEYSFLLYLLLIVLILLAFSCAIENANTDLFELGTGAAT